MPLAGRATTVVVLRTSHDIMVGADSRAVSASDRSVTAPGALGRTLIVVDGRIVCAAAVETNILQDPSYSFSALIGEAKAAAPAGIPVSMFVGLLEAKLAQKFRGVGDLLRAGKVRQDDLAPPHTILLKYYVAGFEAAVPFVYTVEYDVDWEAGRVAGPIVTPQPARKNLSVTWTGGAQRGIIELRKPGPSSSQGAQKSAPGIAGNFAAAMPEESAALQQDRDLPPPKLLRLACGLLDLEVTRNPQNAVYPLTILTLPLSGAPKTAIYQHRCS